MPAMRKKIYYKKVLTMKKKGKRPFKITLTKTKNGDLKIDFEGEDPITTAILGNAFQVIREGAKRLIKKLEEISKELPKKR